MKKHKSSPSCPFCSNYGISHRMIHEGEDVYVVSDLHPIIFGHLLIVTKKHHLSFGELELKSLRKIRDMIIRIAKIIYCFKTNVIVFERGNKNQNTSGILSVDHAHLHLIPVSSMVSELPRKKRVAHFFELPNYVKFSSYYFYWDIFDNLAYWGDANDIESQFIRRVSASKVGKNEWDWKRSLSIDSQAAEQSQIIKQILKRRLK